MSLFFILLLLISICINISLSQPTGTCCDCLTVNFTRPGCPADLECQSIICDPPDGLDPFCCQSSWDKTCTTFAEDICFATATPTTISPSPIPTINPTKSPTIITTTLTPTTNNPSISPTTPSPITSNPTSMTPTLHPTPFNTLPPQCENKCDSVSVILSDVVIDIHYFSICLTYKINRLFPFDKKCKRKINNIILGICEYDNDNCDLSKHDLNNIITDIYSNDYDDITAFGVNKKKLGTGPGIRVNIPIEKGNEDDIIFTLCMDDIFLDNNTYSTIVGFKRKKQKLYVCDELYLYGLPCINHTQLELNKLYYEQYGYKGDSNSYSARDDKTMKIDKKKDENVLKTIDGMNVYLKYSLISLILVFSILIMISFILCLWNHNNGKCDGNKDAIVVAMDNYEHNDVDFDGGVDDNDDGSKDVDDDGGDDDDVKSLEDEDYYINQQLKQTNDVEDEYESSGDTFLNRDGNNIRYDNEYYDDDEYYKD